MNTIHFFTNSYLHYCFLSVSATSGFFLTAFLFLFCFLLVHIFVLLKLGWKAQEQSKKSPPPKKENKPPAPKCKKADKEPIYYIVERKRTRPKQNYGEPKEFRFK